MLKLFLNIDFVITVLLTACSTYSFAADKDSFVVFAGSLDNSGIVENK